jgi:hypothetical protein
LLAGTPEDRRPKAEVEAKDKEIAPDTTTKSCLIGRKQEHLLGNCSKKQGRFPTAIVEYGENEVKDLLALELPKKKKKNIKKKDSSKATCWNCLELGHYTKKCPEVNKQRGTDLVVCLKCNQKGHYAMRCPEKSIVKHQ